MHKYTTNEHPWLKSYDIVIDHSIGLDLRAD